jgi:hypothetical protein
VGQARTGTGKTASFAIPISNSSTGADRRHPQALVLVPTRELAVQVRDEFDQARRGPPRQHRAVYGGKPIRGQIGKLSRGAARSRRHARPRARPPGPRHARFLEAADRRPRRGRPDARHRLPARHRKDPPPLPQGAADAAAQRHGAAAGRASWPSATCATPKRSTSRPRTWRSKRSSSSISPSTERKFDLLVRLLEREQPQAGDRLLPHQAGHEKIAPPAQQEAFPNVGHDPRRHAAVEPATA